MTTPYRDFTTLVIETLKGRDYELELQDRSAPVAVVAIHGGAIEPLTSELARSIAGDDYSLYDFRGIRPRGNEILRVPVSRFDEMRLRGLLGRCHTALSIDGVPGTERVVHVGGRNARLRGVLAEHLSAAQFKLGPPANPGAAHSPDRFYNRTKLGGLHVELPVALRREMVRGDLVAATWEDPQQWGEPFHRFVKAVRDALAELCGAVPVDLSLTMERFEKSTRSFPASLRHQGDNHHH